jgi:hypothetical protein
MSIRLFVVEKQKESDGHRQAITPHIWSYERCAPIRATVGFFLAILSNERQAVRRLQPSELAAIISCHNKFSKAHPIPLCK